MRVSLVYNEEAGDGVPLSQIRQELEHRGYRLVQVVEKGADSERLLEEPCDLVVAAGGDGAVTSVARLVKGRGIPLAILPLGTANNVAKSLGADGLLQQVVRSWGSADRKPLDIGVACGPWGERRFLEGVGAGLIPSGIGAMQAQPADGDEWSDSRLARAVSKYGEVLARLKPRPWTLNLDGVSLTGEFLLVEILNIRFVGPSLELSPDANPSDGLFAVVTAGEEDRQALADYLQRRMEGSACRLSLSSRAARSVDIYGSGDVHVDDEVLSLASRGHVSIRMEPAALEFLA